VARKKQRPKRNTFGDLTRYMRGFGAPALCPDGECGATKKAVARCVEVIECLGKRCKAIRTCGDESQLSNVIDLDAVEVARLLRSRHKPAR
jgi:hypothetical protein